MRDNRTILNSLVHSERPCSQMDRRWVNYQSGKLGWALLWLLGIPLPILIIIYLIRGH
jgi:hypothetical protein